MMLFMEIQNPTSPNQRTCLGRTYMMPTLIATLNLSAPTTQKTCGLLAEDPPTLRVHMVLSRRRFHVTRSPRLALEISYKRIERGHQLICLEGLPLMEKFILAWRSAIPSLRSLSHHILFSKVNTWFSLPLPCVPSYCSAQLSLVE